MNFLPELWNYIRNIFLAVLFTAIVAAGGWATYLYDKSKKPQITDKQLIVEADNALNIGHYPDAKRIFETELKAHPQNQQAAWGLKIATVKETLGRSGYKAALDELQQQNPNDAHVNLFLGEYYGTNNQPDIAINYFEQAAAQNPKLAEAHIALALVYLHKGNFESAKVESLKAVDIIPIPKYRNNLGTVYFKQKHYEEAIKEFGRNKEYPLSALESGKIYWRLEYLSQASSYQKQAIEWLEDKDIMAKPDNQEPWFFENQPGKFIRLMSVGEKKCYAYYSLSVSLYLQGDIEGADVEVQRSKFFKVTSLRDIRALVAADLDDLVLANPSFAGSVASYKQLYLGAQSK
ncbi:MAG: tetratricopeptide repeat protein [Methylococcales bacterium]|nr:tetratricopeptide repeat protein [Methylococcales bacterium]